MVDLHSHFLYGVDDGAKSLDMALEMLVQAETVGITKLLATPHINEQTSPDVEKQIHDTFQSMLKLIKKAGLSIDIKLAAEINIIADESLWQKFPWVLIGDKNKYVLVETPFQNLSDNFADILFQLRLKKITPMLAHPERNIILQDNPSPLIDWINQGCLVQADAGSIVGQFGKKCQKFAERLLKGGAIHVVGSDSHEPRWRNYHVFRDAYNKVENMFDISHANILFDKNPDRIWKGEQITHVPVDESAFSSSLFRKILDVGNW